MQWECPVLKCTQKELQWDAHVMHRKKPGVEWEEIQLVLENWSFHTASAVSCLLRRYVSEHLNDRFRRKPPFELDQIRTLSVRPSLNYYTKATRTSCRSHK